MADLQSILASLLGGDKCSARPFRVARKHGQPFILLPVNGKLATRTLALYPAQSFPARLAKRAMAGALTTGLAFGMERISVSISAANPFVGFLSDCAGSENHGVPEFGILAGNPNAPGQRFVFLLFDDSGRPSAVVKAGTTNEAKELICREKDFLSSASPLPGIPRLKNVFESPAATALAMDFIEGAPPGKADEPKLAPLLASWIKSGPRVSLGGMRVFMELQPHCRTVPFVTEVVRELNERQVSPVLFHGDLAPWNIKTSPTGSWTVFDWERGDLAGMPGYDWFHYFIQTRILVAHESTPVLFGHLQQLFASAEFQRYAGLSGISGIEWQLLMLYLAHHNEVIRPGEGLDAGKELLRAVLAQHSKCGGQRPDTFRSKR